MIYYLSSGDNFGRFDFIKESDDEFIVSAGEFDLKDKLLKRGGGLEHCGVLIIDHNAVTGNTKDIPGCLQSFRLMYPAKVVYFYEGADIGDSLYQALADAGIYNIITSAEPGDIAAEYAHCMAGRTEEEARTGRSHAGRERARRKNYRVSGLRVAVFGAEERAGTTYTAFGLAAFLAGADVRAGYVEVTGRQSRTGHLPPSAALTLAGGPDEKLAANIFDFGVVTPKKAADADQFQKYILCAGWQPWQSDTLSQALFMLLRTGCPVDVVFLPAYDAVKPQLIAKHTGKTVAVHFAGFAPELGDPSANRALFEALMKDWEA